VRQIIHLEPQDSIATVRDKVERAQAKEVLLVVPNKCESLRSLVNLKLLRRYADYQAAQIGLVVRDGEIRTLAKEAGIPVFFSVNQGRRAKMKRTKPKPLLRGADPVALARKAREKRMRLRVPGRGFDWMGLVAGLAVIVFVVLALGVGSLLILPGAEITLVPRTEVVSSAYPVKANPNIDEIDYVSSEIPARIVEIQLEETGQTATTARKDVPEARATGTVIFSNRRSEETLVPQGTVVSTSSGTTVRFHTILDLTLPPNGRGEVGIVALEPGPNGNVSAWQINVVEGGLAFQVDVRNDASTQGGGAKQVGYVTAEDKNRLYESLLQRVRQEGYAQIGKELTEGEFVPPESLIVQVLSETYDRNVGDPADVLNLSMRAKVSGTTISTDDARKLASRLIQFQVPEGHELIPDSLVFQQGEVLQIEGRTAHFSMQVAGTTMAEIDEDEIKGTLRGSPIDDARRYLLENLELNADPAVAVAPNWLNRIPWFSFRISLHVLTG